MKRMLRILTVVIVLAAASDVRALVLPFSAHGTGPFTVNIVPFAANPPFFFLLREDQAVTFDSFLPFPLTTGRYQGFANPAILTFPDRIINTSFVLTNGAGDSLFGAYTVDFSNFTDPLDLLTGDVIGSEDFGGRFTFTGGTGQYARASGGGTYRGHSDYTAADPSSLLSGTSELTATGSVVLPVPSTLLLLGLAVLGVLARRARDT
jgi:hypothetical protein